MDLQIQVDDEITVCRLFSLFWKGWLYYKVYIEHPRSYQKYMRVDLHYTLYNNNGYDSRLNGATYRLRPSTESKDRGTMIINIRYGRKVVSELSRLKSEPCSIDT